MKTLTNLLFTLCLVMISFALKAQNPGGAKLEFDNGKLDKAKEMIDKAIEDPKHNVKSKTWYYRGLIYAGIAGDQTGMYQKLDNDPVQKALDSYKKAMSLEPEKKGSYKDAEKAVADLYGPAVNFGIKCYNEEKLEDAVKCFVVAQQAKPNDLIALVYGGEIAYGAKNYDVFKSSMEKLVQIPLADYTAYNTGKEEKQQFKKQDYWGKLAFYYRDNEKDSNKAIEACKQGLKEFPGENLLSGILMEMYVKENKLEDAVKEAEAQIQKNPNDSRIQLNYGIILEKVGRADDAIKAYEKAVALDPSSFDAQYNLGAVSFNKGAAIMTKVNAMDLGEYNKKGKEEEAKAAKEFEKALPFFEKLYTMKPKEMQVLSPLATIYKILKLKDKEEKINNEIKALMD
jgi:tetratricopeptide (TPR) repeat protein